MCGFLNARTIEKRRSLSLNSMTLGSHVLQLSTVFDLEPLPVSAISIPNAFRDTLQSVMIILSALLLATEVVGMVVNNLTQASDDTNYTQILTFEDPSLSARQKFAISLEVLPNLSISQDALFESMIVDFEELCFVPYLQHLGTRDYTPAGRHDLSITVTQAPWSVIDLTAKYTMSALFLCFVRLLQFPRPGPLTLSAARCVFGLADLDSVRIKSFIGKVEFLPGPVQDSATSSSGPSASVPDDTIAASLNVTGGQGSSSLGNLTSDTYWDFKLNGNGAIISPVQLLISIIAASIDRAGQPRAGPVNARTYTPGIGNYIVQSQAAPGLLVAYGTVPKCFFRLISYLRDHRIAIREGSWTCNKDFRDVLLVTLTKKPGANAGIAAPSTGEPSGSVDVTRRDHQ